jgi:hypothetical protein
MLHRPDREAKVFGEDREDQVAPGHLPSPSFQKSGSSGRHSLIQCFTIVPPAISGGVDLEI